MQNRKAHRNPYLSLIAVLTLPLILISIYSFTAWEVTIGEFTLQKANIGKHFVRQALVVADSIRNDTVIPTGPVIINDTTSQRILLCGDSMLEGLGRRLKDYAGENGHEMLNVMWYSSSTKIWAQSDTLQHFIKKFKPTYVMICLGGNELFVRDLDKREEYVKTILKKIGDLPYIWIGPPNWKADTGINDVIEKSVETYRFFPSKNLQYERDSDGAHPTLESGAQWMDSIAAWMESEPHYRIKMKLPQSDKKSGRTVVLRPLK